VAGRYFLADPRFIDGLQNLRDNVNSPAGDGVPKKDYRSTGGGIVRGESHIEDFDGDGKRSGKGLRDGVDEGSEMAGTIIAGGDIRQLTVGGRALTCAPESSVKISTGGRVNEAKVAGNSKTIITQKPKMAGFSDATVIIDNANQDLEYLQGLEDDAVETATVLTLADGTTYSGKLTVVGELDVDTEAGTLTLEMRGSTFEQI